MSALQTPHQVHLHEINVLFPVIAIFAAYNQWPWISKYYCGSLVSCVDLNMENVIKQSDFILHMRDCGAASWFIKVSIAAQKFAPLITTVRVVMPPESWGWWPIGIYVHNEQYILSVCLKLLSGNPRHTCATWPYYNSLGSGWSQDWKSVIQFNG